MIFFSRAYFDTNSPDTRVEIEDRYSKYYKRMIDWPMNLCDNKCQIEIYFQLFWNKRIFWKSVPRLNGYVIYPRVYVQKNKSSQGWTLGVKFGEFGGESFGKKKKKKVLKALEKRVLDISSFIYL